MLWILGLLAIIVGIVVVVARPAYRGGGFGLVAVGVVLVLIHLFATGSLATPGAP